LANACPPQGAHIFIKMHVAMTFLKSSIDNKSEGISANLIIIAPDIYYLGP